jgi:hypothetical protein
MSHDHTHRLSILLARLKQSVDIGEGRYGMKPDRLVHLVVGVIIEVSKETFRS